MDVTSYYFIRKEKTSLNRQNISKMTYILILGIWTWFCIAKIPQYQEAQRIKVYQEEQQLLLELCSDIYYITEVHNTTPVVIEKPYKEVTAENKIEEVLDPPKYADPDLILLAQLIESEGGIENYQCKLYIGSVVLNRMTSDNHPDGLRDVIFENEPCIQFSVTQKDSKGHRPIDCEPSEDSLKAAAELLTYGTQLPKDVLVFYSTSCVSNWVNSRKTYTQVGNTVFAYAYSK